MSPFAAERDAKQYTKLCEDVLNDGIELSPISEIRDSIKSDKSQMRLYGEKDFKGLLSRYSTKLRSVRSALYDEDKEKYILNILEYIKYTCSGEDYIGIPGVLFFESINNYPYSSLLIGKGTSYSQVRLLQELLDDSSYILTEVQRINQNSTFCETEKYNVLLKDSFFIDPYHYNGKRKNNIAYHFNTMVAEENYDENKRKEAKERVTTYLISLLKIRKISSEILSDAKNTHEKVERIIKYIKDNYKEFNLPVRHYIVEIEDMRIEASRLLELFLIANKIEYTSDDQTDKENTVFNIEKSIIDIKGILTNEKNKKYVKK